MNSIQGQEGSNIADDSKDWFVIKDWFVLIGEIRKLWREKVANLLAGIYWIDTGRFKERITGEKRIDSSLIEWVVRVYHLIMNSSKERIEKDAYFQELAYRSPR